MRKTWRGNMILVNIPNQGYLLAQPSDADFLVNSARAQVDALILSFDVQRNFADIIDQGGAIIRPLPITDSIRVLSPIDPPVEEVPFYEGVDLAFQLNNQQELLVDLQHSGVELAEKTPEYWLSYTEAKGAPIAIFQWPDGKKSMTFLRHIQKSVQNLEDIEAKLIVPSYSFEELDESMLDEEEVEESIAITLQDTLQRAFIFLPNQTSFQIIMPHEKNPRYYSQDPPPNKQIQSGPLGVIEARRQEDNTKVKYYYRPNQSN